MTARKFGRLLNHDEGSRAYGIVVNPRAEIKDVEWEISAPIIDQGDTGMCVGAAFSQYLNILRTRDGRSDWLGYDDALAYYSESTTLDPFPGTYPPDDTGTDAVSMCKVGQRHNLVSQYRHAFGLLPTLLAIQKGPVMCGTVWKSGMNEPDADGIIHATGDDIGGHEYVLVGTVPAAKQVIMLNSWSDGWGRDGRAHISYDDLAILLKDDGDVTIPMEMKS